MRVAAITAAGLALAALVGAAGAQAAGPLVPGELRLGADRGSPLVQPGPGPNFAVKQLNGLRFESAAGPTVTCPVTGGAETGLNGDTSSLFWTNPGFDCATTIPGADYVVVGQGGLARVRFELDPTPGGRDGVVDRDPRTDKWQLDLFIYDDQNAYVGSCSYRFDPAVRLDVFNPGEGHRIVYRDEALTYLAPTGGATDYGACPADEDPDTADATVNQDVRMRFWSGGVNPFGAPVWLGPVSALR